MQAQSPPCRLNQQQTVKDHKTACTIRITHNADICIIEAQLSGRVPDTEVEEPELTTPSIVNNLCPHGPQHHGVQLIHKQVTNHTQAACKLRITHKVDICVIEDQLSGRVPDTEVE